MRHFILVAVILVVISFNDVASDSYANIRNGSADLRDFLILIIHVSAVGYLAWRIERRTSPEETKINPQTHKGVSE